MTSACQFLHQKLNSMPRFKANFNPNKLPLDGLYFLFEAGETGHGSDRVVRVGTHTGKNNLLKRLNEHLFTQNKDRSIFRKHIGRCLLTREKSPFLEYWNIDLTERKQRDKFDHLVDKEYLREIENNVSTYINEKFSFVVLEIENKESRLQTETQILSTIAQCPACAKSANWLGNYHPHRTIREKGLWNIQGVNGIPLNNQEISALFNMQKP